MNSDSKATHHQRKLSTLLLGPFLFQLVGCSDVRLRPIAPSFNEKASRASSHFCTTEASEIRSNLKFIFVVDRSGSNQLRYLPPNFTIQAPGTDPTGVRRFGALSRFVQATQDDPYVYWSMVSFNSGLDRRNSVGFTNQKPTFANFLQDQKNRTASIDVGATNYLEALGEVEDMIRQDVTLAKAQQPVISSNYVIFFVSDGAPLVQGVLQDRNAILNQVTAITNIEEEEKLVVDGVQVNTAYYFEDPSDPAARDLLDQMSLAGNGDFLEFAAGQEIDFSRFSVPVRIMRLTLKELWVTNLNTVWDLGTLKADSDGDGLSDELELALGSNTSRADSDSNGVSDLVEYRISGNQRVCANPSCSPTGADPYTSCRSLELPAGSPTRYADIDKDFLNDCEEKLLGSDKNDFDSNDDYIPDDLALRNGVSMVEQSNAGYIDPDFDRVTNYEEIKYNTPLDTNNSNVPGLIRMIYEGGLVSSTATQDCYDFTVSNVARRSSNDMLRIYLMENSRALTEKRIMRVSQKPLGDTDSVTFSEGEFQ